MILLSKMLESHKPVRRSCERCARPLAYCLCDHVQVVNNRTRVLVLQHPTEAKHPLNTARLAVLGLSRAELWIGEHFPQLESHIALAGQALLLFPSEEPAQCPPVDHARAADPSLLIVPDGTWRKARKIIHMNPALDRLPRFSLPPGDPSQYRIRKAPGPEAVSTIEAIVRALSVLEPEHDFHPLLKPFNVLVEQQIAAMGEEVYRRNYQMQPARQ